MKPDPLEEQELLSRYTAYDGVRLNLALSQTGSVSGDTGTSDDVSNKLDRALLAHLRSQADVIVTSGATARAENLRPSKLAPIFVLSKSGNIDALARLLSTPTGLPVTLVVPMAVVETLTETLQNHGWAAPAIGLPNLEPAAVIGLLRQLGYKRILLEVGPTLASIWTSVDAVGELCLTTTELQPNEAGGSMIMGVAASLPDFIFSDKPALTADFYSQATGSKFERWSL